MRDLVSYTCSSCGGALTVDKSQEVYECPFCGNAYDFVQMHHDELLADAETNMRQMEFTSAKEKYSAILESDPQDFYALRGLVLCSGPVISTESFKKPEKLTDCSFDQMKDCLNKVKEQAKEADQPYFEKLYELVDLAQKHKAASEEKARLSGESNRRFGEIVEVELDREEANEEAWEKAKSAGRVIAAVTSKHSYGDDDSRGVYGLVIGGFTIIIVLIYFLSLWAFAVIAGVAAIVIAVLIFNKRSDEKRQAEISEQMKVNNGKSGAVATELAETGNKYSQAYRALVKMEPKTNKAAEVKYTPKTF